ncbi:SWIM zinc finger family protein [Acrocarpospora corrugata]|uniref:SWIM zinc finger family protein n=1 Tax=Acrocarpospora corrugata TaxID=35763 RepID=UPI001FEB80A0|nr:SWIM zinc finger family protein [Acrocarpospora corrugata]
MIERWSRDQVLALAPDASSQKAAAGVSAPAKWSGAGVARDALWGECKGSGSKPYRACVDLREPAYRCSCPSRKFPCKHALGLLLLWSADGVPAADEPADWVEEWLADRRERAAKQEAKVAEKVAAIVAAEAASASDRSGASDGSGGSGGYGASGGSGGDDRRARQREERVDAGLADLERWLSDQIAHGIAGARQTALADWDDLSKRLIDAQAPGVAALLTGLSRVFRHEDWPARLLTEYALVHLLAVAHRRSADLPRDLRDTVRSRVGFTTPKEYVLAQPPVRDHWQVIACRDEDRDRLLSRRVWLHGRATGRIALILSFAPVGQPLDSSLVLGTTIDASLCFYPGSAPLRALVAARHSAAPSGGPPSHGVGEADRHSSPASGEAPPRGERAADRHSAAASGEAPFHGVRAADGHSSPASGEVQPGGERAADRYSPPASGGVPPRGERAADRHSAGGVPPHGVRAVDVPRLIADVLARDPWTDSWPLILSDVVPARVDSGWYLADHDPHDPKLENALPLLPGTLWQLAAVSGGHPVTVAAEWTPDGLRLLTTWDERGQVVVL